MIIKTTDREIRVKSVISEQMRRGGHSYPALRFEFEDAITADDANALCLGTFDICDDDGNVIGTHEGYNTKGSISFVVGKITTADQQIAALENELANLQEAVNIVVGGDVE